jgi:hypothetical protein
MKLNNNGKDQINLISIITILLLITLISLSLYTLARVANQPAPLPAEPQTTITWRGYLVYAVPNPEEDAENPLAMRTEGRVQIGLKSDGTMVWRALQQEPEPVQEGEQPE